MSRVSFTIAGRVYDLVCRDGEEAHLHGLATVVGTAVEDARSALGRLTEARELVVAALLLADRLADAERAAAKARSDAVEAEAVALALDHLAERLESLADGLEKPAATH